MDINDANLQLLAGYLEQTFSPNQSVRGPAEKLLREAEVQPNYGVLMLTIMDSTDFDIAIRIACSVTFKNFIRRNWAAHEDDGGPDKIPEGDRTAIKRLIVSLMLRSHIQIQRQLSEVIGIIGKHDFPKKWPQLIDEMVEKFGTGDFNVINGVLRTANSLFKRYRYEFKSQALWEEIKLVLDGLAKPLTDLLQATMSLAKVHANNTEALKVIYDSLVLMCKVFFSLNAQDLPEFFEDNMSIWMGAFHEFLTTDIASLRTRDDSTAGVLEHLRSQVCENIGVYAQKYDEEFTSYIETFVTAVWNLLVKTGLETKYDTLVSHALHFLSIVAERNQYRKIFENPEILASICEKVVIPNLDFRLSDQELFYDNCEEYIRRDIEGSDIDTRRRSACDLVKTLSQKFEDKIFAIFGQYLEILLAKYNENCNANWRSKDTAIYLVTSLASRGSTQKHGVTQASQLVPLGQFCAQHIIPELEKGDMNSLPVLRSAAIKFVMTFRSLLGPQTLLACIPHLIMHLKAPSPVVHSYAACAIDKILIMRDSNNAFIINQQHLTPFAAELFINLFATILTPNLVENEYSMKAIMRTLYTLDEAAMPYMAEILPNLTAILNMVARNPSRPHFNHFLFESLSLAIKIVCKKDQLAVSSFEQALFPIFQDILQLDILEFIPYVFQMLSLLLEVREGKGPIPDPYWALFPCLLAPSLWDRPGNISPLIRLICTFIKQGSAQISALGKLNPVLGIYQKMIASKTNDHEGFYLMQNLLTYYPLEELQPSMRQIFALLFQRLSLSKTTKYVRGLIVFFCYYATKIGASALVELIDQIQANMFGMVIDRVFIPDMSKAATEMDRKIVAVGITKILTECPAMLAQPNYVAQWTLLLQALVELFELPPNEETLDGDHFVEVDDAPGYQAAFSQLSYAQPKQQDFLSEITDPRKFLAESLVKLVQAHPTEVPPILLTLSENHKLAIKKYCEQAGVRLI